MSLWRVCQGIVSSVGQLWSHLGKLEALSKLLHHSHKKPRIVYARRTDFSKRCWRFKSCPVCPWTSRVPLWPRLVPSPLGVSLSVSRLSLSTQRCLDWGCRYSLAAKSCWHVGNPWVKRLSVFRLKTHRELAYSYIYTQPINSPLSNMNLMRTHFPVFSTWLAFFWVAVLSHSLPLITLSSFYQPWHTRKTRKLISQAINKDNNP